MKPFLIDLSMSSSEKNVINSLFPQCICSVSGSSEFPCVYAFGCPRFSSTLSNVVLIYIHFDITALSVYAGGNVSAIKPNN